ncbi:MAG: glycosyltransferase [Ignavibacteriaceae bacterium]
MKNPQIVHLDYASQYEHIMAQKYGWADFFKKHFEKNGFECIELVYNAQPLQNAWGKEFGFENEQDILLKQIEFYHPEIIFFQDSVNFSYDFYASIRKKVPSIKLMFGHCCSPFTDKTMKTFSIFDFMLACPPFVDKLLRNNIKCYKMWHGFETSILDLLGDAPLFSEYDFTFIGSFMQGKDFHKDRLKLIEELLKMKINIYLNTPKLESDSSWKLQLKRASYLGVKLLKHLELEEIVKKNSKLYKISKLTELPRNLEFSKSFLQTVDTKPLFGLEMYRTLRSSKIGFNIHGGIAADFAANVRLFETTGVGTLLLTDYKSNITEVFEPDKEIVTYKSVAECVAKTRWLLENEGERTKIAKSGQQRCLRDHSLEQRVEQITEIIGEFLK